MVDDLRAMVKGWLIKAKHDLESAYRLSDGDDPLLDTAIYHCQQAAENLVAYIYSLLPPTVVEGL